MENSPEIPLTKNERRKLILQAFKEIGSQTHVARMFNVSRQRISKILSEEIGARSYFVQSADWFDWDGARKVRKVYKISYYEIAKRSGLSFATVRKIFSRKNGDIVSNVRASSRASSVRVIAALLQIAAKRIKDQEKATRELILEFQKLKYNYLDD